MTEEEVLDFGKKKKKDKKEKKGGDDGAEELDFGKKRDKKEKKEKKLASGDGKDDDEVNMVETEFEQGQEFTYEDLLERLHGIIEAKHAGLGTQSKYTLKPPQITRVGAKKTGWVNFVEICENMKRNPEHLQSYVFAELGCDGTFAGEGQFILKGRFYARNIESLLRKYIREYVMCQMCKSSNTKLVKDQATRLTNIACNNCGASRSCANIKSGFHAVAKGERKRAKQAEGNLQVVA